MDYDYDYLNYKLRNDVEVYITKHEVIILGDPDEVQNHNCDEMGCTSVAHTLIRLKRPEWLKLISKGSAKEVER